uniref:Uncharacterized protein n=1 Tax=Arundo donax TaxID=35708 RepID=A0A0A9F0H3_ARUDO
MKHREGGSACWSSPPDSKVQDGRILVLSLFERHGFVGSRLICVGSVESEIRGGCGMATSTRTAAVSGSTTMTTVMSGSMAAVASGFSTASTCFVAMVASG